MKNNSMTIQGMVYASLFGAATAAGAYIIIPTPPVPITLQTLFLMLAGALLGGRLGAMSQIVYILIGIMGLPVFAGGKAGLGVLFGPTGGYLVGFVAAAFVIGWMMQIKNNAGAAWAAFSMILGTAVIYLLGVAQLSIVANLSLIKAVSLGAVPFLIGDAVKVTAAVIIYTKLKGHIRPER